jgi:hypothetical protein
LSDPTLTVPAPSGSEVDPSVEVNAPGATGEVANGSGEFVDKARFDGLMGRFNRAQNEVERERQRAASLEARLAELEAQGQSQPAQETQEVSDPALVEQVQLLTGLLLKERTENARKQVLDDYPELKPFEDLLVADSPEDLREIADVFSARLKQVTGTPEATPAGEPAPAPEATAPPAEAPAPEAPAAPVAPVAAGGQTVDPSAPLTERIQEAVQNKDFGAFLKASRERALLEAEGVLQD